MSETRPVRSGEEIDVSSLTSFLSRELEVPTAEIEVEQFPGGSSNLTYLVRVSDSDSSSRPAEQNFTEYVLRRPPFGNTVRSAHDMGREFEVLSKLSIVYPPSPKPLLYCADASVIGSEFYLMERREGMIVRGKFPSKPGTEHVTVCRSFIKNLSDLHSLDPAEAGLESLGRIDGYCRRQVEGWTKRYAVAKTHDWPALDETIAWLGQNIPTESRASLVHNDYKFDNIMLDPNDLTRITAVLDWEMATIGDPLMDLGTTLGYWMSGDAPDGLMDMPFNARVLMENVTRRELVEMYAEARGCELPDMLFYYVFGTFKIAVIAQQIYARYAKGATSDARFSSFDKFVAALGRIAAAAIEKGSI